MSKHKRLKGTKTLVGEIYAAHPEWNAAKVYNRYLILIGNTEKAVTLNAVQKQLVKLRQKNKEIDESGFDAEWHIDDINVHPMDAQSVNNIFRVLRWLETNDVDTFKLTKRQAKWISRIYHIEYLESDSELWRASLMCAILERYSELTEIPCSIEIETLFLARNSTEYEQRIDKLLEDKSEIFLKYIVAMHGLDWDKITKEGDS